MRERGEGTILISNNSSSLRGKKRYTGESLYFPRVMMRTLAQALTEEYSEYGVHVANVVVDGTIDSPGTQALPRFQQQPELLINPVKIAEAFLLSAHPGQVLLDARTSTDSLFHQAELLTPNTKGRRVKWNTIACRKQHIFSSWRNRRSAPAKRIVLISRPLHPAWSIGSVGRFHCGSRPSIHHQAKIRPETSCVSKTRNLAVLGGGRHRAWRRTGRLYRIHSRGTDRRADQRISDLQRLAPDQRPGAGSRPRRHIPARSRHTRRRWSPPSKPV